MNMACFSATGNGKNKLCLPKLPKQIGCPLQPQYPSIRCPQHILKKVIRIVQVNPNGGQFSCLGHPNGGPFFVVEDIIIS